MTLKELLDITETATNIIVKTERGIIREDSCLSFHLTHYYMPDHEVILQYIERGSLIVELKKRGAINGI